MSHSHTTTGFKRATCFIDGQNLFSSAKQAFGYRHANFDPKALSEHLCAQNDWALQEVRFYSGIPSETHNAEGHHFWQAKGAKMGRDGVHVYFRPLVYRDKIVELADGTTQTVVTAQEKGIDVRLALEVIRAANDQSYDVVVLFSRDNDLSEVADEVRSIARQQGRVIQIFSAYPYSAVVKQYRGIANTGWKPIDRLTYDACLDRRNYRPKRRPVADLSSLFGVVSNDYGAAAAA